jgi:hypothetical protein
MQFKDWLNVAILVVTAIAIVGGRAPDASP